jgi:hypothetical protein
MGIELIKALISMHKYSKTKLMKTSTNILRMMSPSRETLNKWLRGRIAALRGARSLAYLLVMRSNGQGRSDV